MTPEGKNGNESPTKTDLLEKDAQKVKLNDGEVVATSGLTAAPAQGDKKKKERNIKSEYYPLPAKHEDVWQAVKEMYGLNEVSVLINLGHP